MQLRCKNMSLEDWQEIISFLNPNMELLNETPPSNKEDLKCHCKTCDGTFSRSTQLVKNNYYTKIKKKSKTNWCPVCSNKMVIPGINDIATLRPDLVKYFRNKEDTKKYVPQSGETVELECPDCHTVKKNKNTNINN